MFEIVGIQGTFMKKSEKTLRKLLFLSLLTDTTFLSFLPKPPHLIDFSLQRMVGRLVKTGECENLMPRRFIICKPNSQNFSYFAVLTLNEPITDEEN